jgi:Uma2 family endonuclease
MQVQEKLYTAADLWELSRDGRRRELVKGVIVEMSPTGDVHGVVAAWVGHLILAHVDAHDLGEVAAAETGFRLSTDPDTVRAPDVAVIRKERLEPMTGRYYTIAPDLAVEVVSPGDTASDIHDKVRDFLQAGTRLVWVIYPSSRTVVVHTLARSETLEGDAPLDGGEVLPGFKLPASDVFGKLRP